MAFFDFDLALRFGLKLALSTAHPPPHSPLILLIFPISSALVSFCFWRWVRDIGNGSGQMSWLLGSTRVKGSRQRRTDFLHCFTFFLFSSSLILAERLYGGDRRLRQDGSHQPSQSPPSSSTFSFLYRRCLLKERPGFFASMSSSTSGEISRRHTDTRRLATRLLSLQTREPKGEQQERDFTNIVTRTLADTERGGRAQLGRTHLAHTTTRP